MKKLLASDVIEIDDKFLIKIKEALKDSEQKTEKNPSVIGNIYTVLEIAEKTKVNRATILRHIDSGILKASKPAKSWIIKEEDLQVYLNRKSK